MERILVIRLGALGDFVLSTGPFAAIRRHHAGAHVTLLTTAAFAGFAAQAPWFDDVWVDRRPGPLDVPGWLALRRRLRGGRFERVYDLQTSDRTGFYFRLMAPGRPEWSGIARGCSHPDDNPARRRIHTLERQAEQLRRAGIAEVPPPDLSWVRGDAARFGLGEPYALLVPGAAAHRPDKRWPAERYGVLAGRLAARGCAPVVLGTEAEGDAIDAILAAEPRARDLRGQTSFADIVALARGAAAAVGNDTGPMHLIAAAGCPAVVLFSSESDPERTAPRAPPGAPPVTVLREPVLDRLPLEAVAEALEAQLSRR